MNETMTLDEAIRHAEETAERSDHECAAQLAVWLRELKRLRDKAGMACENPCGHIAPLLSDRVGIFVGGSSEWKDRTTPMWAALAHRLGSYCHVGRVNTKTRLHICRTSGVDSIDGSGPSRLEKCVWKMDRWLMQECMELYNV
jgi:hypothetical protein